MANTYYTEAELETLLSKSPILNRGEYSLYDLPKYRLAGMLYCARIAGLPDYLDTGLSYSKGDTVRVVERYARTVIQVAISLYNTTPTFAQIVSAIQVEGKLPYLTAYWLAYAVLEVWFSFPTEVGSQVLINSDVFTANWTLAGGFSAAAGKLVYAHNAGPNTAIQVVGAFLIPGVASKWYKFDYTFSDFTLAGATVQLSTGFPVAAIALSNVTGKHTAFFISAATLPGAGNFIITVPVNGDTGGFKIDDLKLTQLIPAFLDLYDPAGNPIGNGVTMSLEGKQKIAYQITNAVRELCYGELATYGPNPIS